MIIEIDLFLQIVSLLIRKETKLIRDTVISSNNFGKWGGAKLSMISVEF